jgi:hypothetical protein
LRPPHVNTDLLILFMALTRWRGRQQGHKFSSPVCLSALKQTFSGCANFGYDPILRLMSTKSKNPSGEANAHSYEDWEAKQRNAGDVITR